MCQDRLGTNTANVDKRGGFFGRTATVRFFGEPEDESIEVEEDDDGDKHYTLEVPAESIERASFWCAKHLFWSHF